MYRTQQGEGRKWNVFHGKCRFYLTENSDAGNFPELMVEAETLSE
jgi:hypothetical protein